MQHILSMPITIEIAESPLPDLCEHMNDFEIKQDHMVSTRFIATISKDEDDDEDDRYSELKLQIEVIDSKEKNRIRGYSIIASTEDDKEITSGNQGVIHVNSHNCDKLTKIHINSNEDIVLEFYVVVNDEVPSYGLKGIMRYNSEKNGICKVTAVCA